MIPILRHEPGSIVPASGMYTLIGHFGESLEISLWFDKGEVLPARAVSTELGPLWWVQVEEAHQATRVA